MDQSLEYCTGDRRTLSGLGEADRSCHPVPVPRDYRVVMSGVRDNHPLCMPVAAGFPWGLSGKSLLACDGPDSCGRDHLLQLYADQRKAYAKVEPAGASGVYRGTLSVRRVEESVFLTASNGASLSSPCLIQRHFPVFFW